MELHRSSSAPSKGRDGDGLLNVALRKKARAHEKLINNEAASDDEAGAESPERKPVLPHLRHLRRKQPEDTRALKVDFKYLLVRHGSYSLARRALRRASMGQIAKRAERLRNEKAKKQAAVELRTIVRLSTTTGTPTLTNPIEQQLKLQRKRRGKPKPPPRTNKTRYRTKAGPGGMTEDEKERLRLQRLKFDRAETAAELARDWERQQNVKRAFENADADKNGKLDRAEFKNVLIALDLGPRPPDVDLGVPSEDTCRRREEEWFDKADVYKSGFLGLEEALGVLPDLVVEGLAEDERERGRVVAYRELLLMEGEDFDAEEYVEPLSEYDQCIADALALPTYPYKPFALEQKPPAPAPPAWRADGGATGEPCEAPPNERDACVRETWRALETHAIVCVERGLEHLPLLLGSTLFCQIGIKRIQLPRNRITSFHAFTRTPAVGARSLSSVVELRLPGNRVRFLPEDVGLMGRLHTCDLSRNALTELPESFVEKLEQLIHLDLTHNNFKTLPDDLGLLTALEDLGLAENILLKLPSTLPRLHRLKSLDVSGNGLQHLCVFPFLPDVARNRAAGEDDWDARIEPLSRRAYYVNVRTGKVSKTLPAVLRGASNLAKGRLPLGRCGRRVFKSPPPVDASLRLNTVTYNSRRVQLAGIGVDEWAVDWSDAENSMTYTSNVNGETVFEFPSSLDKLGQLRSLTSLKCDRNQLRELPPSLGQLKELALLRVRSNYLRFLPDATGDLSKLERLDCATNELSTLPGSVARLSKLEFLSLQSNRYEKLPPLIGKLVGLRRLYLGNNSLATLPYEVGFLTTLTELQVFNNPLEDPPYESINDLPRMMWSCRQKYWALINGTVPVVASRRMAIGDEVLEPEPAYQQRMHRAVEEASATGRLELQLQGVSEIPGASRVKGSRTEWEHPRLEGCKVLKLSMNHFLAPPLLTPSLGNLRVLWLKACEIDGLNDDIQNLQRLKELILEHNSITKLPRTFCRLRRLETLNLAKNKLYQLPDRLGNLTALTKLDVSMNNLEFMPRSLTSLRCLRELSCASNALYALPVLSPGLSSLTTLNLDANDLYLLPKRLGELPLKTLRASHNRLERLEADTFLGRAQGTLELLGVAANNLLELPSCLPLCTALRTVHVEYNPMRNPPAELLSEGMDILIQYCRIRDVRMEKFKQLLSEFQFDFDPAHMAPEAYGVLTGRTGFLTPDDLVNFDKQADTYLNSNYYACPSSDVQIMERVDNLRHEREHTFYHTILLSLIDLITEEVQSNGDPRMRLFACGVLIEEMRPWGREGEDVGAYALALDALVKEGPPNRYRRKTRPALFEILKERLPPSLFDYTLEVLKDAIQKYGHVAQLDKVEFDRCECVDEKGRSRGHQPCVLPAIVIEKVIYSAGEATRRTQEEDKIRREWRDLWRDVETKIRQRHGKLILNNEVHRRKRTATSKIKAEKEKLDAAKSEVKQYLEKFEIAKRRKINFENGDAFNFHRLESADEAEELVVDAAEEVDREKARVADCEQLLAMAKMQAKVHPKIQTQIAVRDLKRKYCVLKYTEVIDENRREACDNDWRRPWDGVDGTSFKDFNQKYGHGIRMGQVVDSL